MPPPRNHAETPVRIRAAHVTQRPEQWVAWFLSASPADQLVAARAVIDNAHTAWRCRAEAHGRWLREAREGGFIPWPTNPATVGSDGSNDARLS